MYDVIVVGAGPAGSTAAYHCAKAGLKTLILEKDKVPRRKICAGGFGILFKDVPECAKHVVKQQIDGIIYFVDDFRTDVELGMSTVERKDFDYALLKRAIGAGAIFKQARVESVEKGKFPVVKTNKNNYQTKIIIGADGVMNTVAKSVGLYREREYSVAFEIEDKMPKDIPKRYGNNTVVFFDYDLFGYRWIFPKGDLINVGVGIFPQKKEENIPKLLREFVDKYKINVDKKKIVGYPIPCGVLPKIYTDNVMLTGDAAGFLDQLTGGGIELAMISGKNAAKVAAEAIKANDFSEKFLSRYFNECSFIYRFINSTKVRYKIFKLLFDLRLFRLLFMLMKVEIWIRSRILEQKRMEPSEI
jgi:geranylgeranyl reductase family protein